MLTRMWANIMTRRKQDFKSPEWGVRCVAHIKQFELVIDGLQNLAKKLKKCGLYSMLIIALPYISDFLTKIN